MALIKRTYIDRETVITADNLNDIQDSIIALESEIDDKVNEPSTEGTAGQVLATDGAGTRYWKTVSGGGGGTSDYTDLDNKPQINGVTLVGNKATADLGIVIPTKTSDLTNDSGFVTNSYHDNTKQDKLTAGENITIVNNVISASGGSGGTTDYTQLTNKPQINGVTLLGNKTTSDLAISYNDLTNKPTIPSAVTEATVSGWGFTKNTGNYSKPASGIPKTDLASAVQTSLGLADTALQSYTETDPTVPSHVKAITQADINKWNAGGGGGTSDYAELDNKPQINGVTLLGNKTISDLGITEVIYTKAEVDALISNIFNTFAPNAGSHNAIYRGKFLGSSVTSAQYSAISNGTFEDLYIGDYWTINEVDYRIADFDYFLKSGDTECTQHHAVIVPDTALYNAQMNTSNTATGAYVGSGMRSTNLATAKTTISNAFGNAHILNHREFLKNAVTSGYESGGTWYNSDIELMTEQMVYGTIIFANTVAGTNLATKYTVGCKQLNLFRHRPDLISNRITYWLRDVANDSSFATVIENGICDFYSATNSFGVRPCFCITGA